MYKKFLLGSHVGFKSKLYLIDSVNEAIKYNANCFMIFTGPPQNLIRKDIDINQVLTAHKIMEEKNISKDNIVIHAPYLINLCSPEKTRRDFSVEILTKELIRTNLLGFRLLVLHPGNYINLDIKTAIQYIADGINKCLNDTKNTDTMIIIETMAGKGTEIGSKLEELKEIIDLIEDKKRIGVCIDTCHVHEAGYDIKNCKNFLQIFNKIIGLDYLKVIHLNDSKNEIGAKKDRHENIGFGKIGFNVLYDWVSCDLLENIPKILETPYYNNISIYKEEIEMLCCGNWKNIKNE